jgi:hypothetical protein
MRTRSVRESSKASVVALAIAVPTSAFGPVCGTSSATRWRSVSVGKPGPTLSSGFVGGGGVAGPFDFGTT